MLSESRAAKFFIIMNADSGRIIPQNRSSFSFFLRFDMNVIHLRQIARETAKHITVAIIRIMKSDFVDVSLSNHIFTSVPDSMLYIAVNIAISAVPMMLYVN